MAKEGSTVGGMMDAFGTAISVALQYGVPLEDLVNKFSHMRFEPMGHTTNPDIRIAKSVVDYIFRWMGIRFLAGYKEANSGVGKIPAADKAGEEDDASARGPAATKVGGPVPAESLRQRLPWRRSPRCETAPPLTSPPCNGHSTATPTARMASRSRAFQWRGERAERSWPDAADRRQRPPNNQRQWPQRAVRPLPARRPELRQLRRHHRPQRQLLPLPQLRQ